MQRWDGPLSITLASRKEHSEYLIAATCFHGSAIPPGCRRRRPHWRFGDNVSQAKRKKKSLCLHQQPSIKPQSASLVTIPVPVDHDHLSSFIKPVDAAEGSIPNCCAPRSPMVVPPCPITSTHTYLHMYVHSSTSARDTYLALAFRPLRAEPTPPAADMISNLRVPGPPV